MQTTLIGTVAPPLFVFIWSTGFVVARAVKGAIDPNLFLTVRFALTGLLFIPIALAVRAHWPRPREALLHAFAGSLLTGLYLGPAYWAVSQGLPASVVALLGSMQPLLVALLARVFLAERVPRQTWLGLLIGLAGVALAIGPGLEAGTAGGSPLVLAAAALGMLSMAIGTLVQKTSLAAADLRVTSALQNLGAAAATGVLALLLDETQWAAGPEQWASLGWAVVGLSGVGTTLLVWMVRTGSATRASALLLLVPPLVAVETFLLFGETLTKLQLAGFAVALLGVWLARREPGPRAAHPPAPAPVRTARPE